MPNYIEALRIGGFLFYVYIYYQLIRRYPYGLCIKDTQRVWPGVFVVDSRISQKAGIQLVVVNLINFDKIQTGALLMIYHGEHKCNTF